MQFKDLKDHSKSFSDANIDKNTTLTKGASQTALILYTSGSTGVPKGVRLSHRNVQNRLEWQWEKFPYSKTEIYGIFKSALPFVDSVSEIWGILLSGLALVIVPKEVKKDPSEFSNILEEYKIERIILIPGHLRSLLLFLSLQEKKMLNNLKICINSSENLSVQLANEFFDYFNEGNHKLYNLYGTTEVN